jgi:predicted flap endonuclease-1-like 5' DNA nuclease
MVRLRRLKLEKGTAMTKKKSTFNSKAGVPPETDDLKLINGIGPVIESHLNKVGIFTFAHLAMLSPADLAEAVSAIHGLSAQQISAQDWIGQARKLASESISSVAQKEVEALAELQAPIEHAHSATSSDDAPPVVAELELAAPAAEVTEPVPPIVAPPGPKEDQISSPTAAIAEPIGALRLIQVETIPTGSRTTQNCYPYGQPLDIRLTLDLSDINVPGDTQLSYRVSIYSKSLEGDSRHVVGETSGIVTYTDKFTVGIEGIALPKGTYRLKAMVILTTMTLESTRQSSLVASKASDLLLIF